MTHHFSNTHYYLTFPFKFSHSPPPTGCLKVNLLTFILHPLLRFSLRLPLFTSFHLSFPSHLHHSSLCCLLFPFVTIYSPWLSFSPVLCGFRTELAFLTCPLRVHGRLSLVDPVPTHRFLLLSNPRDQSMLEMTSNILKPKEYIYGTEKYSTVSDH